MRRSPPFTPSSQRLHGALPRPHSATTGAYVIGRCERGRLIELRRNPHWWAADLRYRRYTCNADSIEHHFLTDEAQAWELLCGGVWISFRRAI